MEATNDRGADVVINTLQGELMQAAWKCVAMHGMVCIYLNSVFVPKLTCSVR
jgi:NADPH:quinone reductase-like Zn-dependent oxidoreductase